MIEEINLNLIPSGVSPVCHVSQYDAGRQIKINLFEGINPYTIQSGDTFTLNVRKPDNTIVTTSVSGTQGNNYIIISTTQQIAAVVGENLCELKITNGSTIIGTLNFIMQVERDVLSDGVPSQSVIDDLQAQVNAAISEGMTDINNDLNSTKSLTGLRWFNGYYQTSDNRFVSTQYWKMSNAIPVTTGDTITYCGKAAQTSRHVVVFFDKAGSFLSGLSALGSDFVEVTFTIPANAEFMRVLAETATLNKTYIIYGLNSGQNPLGENRKRVIAIEDNLSNIENELKPLITIGGITWFDGYYQTSNNAYVTTQYWKTSNFIPCKAGDTFIYCGSASQANRRVVVFFDKGGSFLSALSNIGSDFVEVTVTIPAGAEYFRVLALTASINQTYIKYGNSANQNPITENRVRINALETGNQIAYIDGAAATNGIGTLTSPYNDIMSAINAGYLNLKVKAGVYQIPLSIHIQNKNFNISLWSNKSSFDTNIPNREKIIIYRGDILTPTSSGGLLVANYTPRSDKRFEKVFVSRTLAPIDSSFLYAVAYNTNVFLWKYGHKARRYEPVLPEDFTGASGTFTYDNGQIQLAPFDSDLNVSGLNIYVSDDADILMNFENCGKVSVNSVAILGAYSGGLQLHGCQESIISDSDFICTGHGDGLEAWDSNVKLQNCFASGCCQDGYGFQHYGDSIMINCKGFYSGDDGVSHHRGCTGYIEGGEFSYNVSGGITPAFGATINIANAKTFNNGYGLQFLGSSGFLKRELLISNCLSKNNSVRDIYNSGYFIDFVNCVYGSQEATSGNENNFYN